MAFIHMKNVYDCVRRTNGTQQAVLLALNFHRHKDTDRCFVSYETLATETRFEERTIIRAAKALRKLGYISWVSGGRTKSGISKANDYSFRLPATLEDGGGAVDNSVDNSVHNSTAAESSVTQSATPVCLPVQDQSDTECKTRATQSHTNLNLTLKNKPPTNHGGGISDSSSGGGFAGFIDMAKSDLLSELNSDTAPQPQSDAPQQVQRRKINVLAEAMAACNLAIVPENKDKHDALLNEIRLHDARACLNKIREFKNESKEGIRDLFKVLRFRLKSLPPQRASSQLSHVRHKPNLSHLTFTPT